MKVKTLITDIEKRIDKNQNDYWIIRTQLDQFTNKTYLAFSSDYNISHQTKSLLINYSARLVKHWAVLTIKKNEKSENIINLEIEK